MLKVALVGFGGIGAVHAQSWQQIPDVKLIAVAGHNKEKTAEFAASVGAHAYYDEVALLNAEAPDVVDICVGTAYHAKTALYCMERVKNVILEKPLCLTESEAQALLEAEKRTGCFVQAAHVVRYMKPYRVLKELVQSGKMGKLVTGSFSRISPRPTWVKSHDDPNKTGTMTLDLHIHDVDFVRYLMGREPDDLQVHSVKDENGIVQHIQSVFSYGDALLRAEGSWNYPASYPFGQTFRVRMEHGAAELERSGRMMLYPAEGEAICLVEEPKQEDLGINLSDAEPFVEELGTFARAITSCNRENTTDLRDAAASFRLTKKILSMAENA